MITLFLVMELLGVGTELQCGAVRCGAVQCSAVQIKNLILSFQTRVGFSELAAIEFDLLRWKALPPVLSTNIRRGSTGKNSYR